MSRHFQMLLYKNWLEGRTKFFISVILITSIILYIIGEAGNVIDELSNSPQKTTVVFTQYVWVVLYKGYLLTFFTISCFIFGIGGLVQEKQNGASAFTLSLPVSRSLIFGAKISFAVAEVAGLAFLQILVVPLISALFGHYYPVRDAVLFSILMTGGGLVIMFLGVFLSCFTTREFVIPTVGISILATAFFILRLPQMRPVNIFNLMCGAGYLSNDSFLFVRPINLNGLLACLFISFLSYVAVRKIMIRNDF